jgi:hypothetical protein
VDKQTTNACHRIALTWPLIAQVSARLRCPANGNSALASAYPGSTLRRKAVSQHLAVLYKKGASTLTTFISLSTRRNEILIQRLLARDSSSWQSTPFIRFGVRFQAEPHGPTAQKELRQIRRASRVGFPTIQPRVRYFPNDRRHDVQCTWERLTGPDAGSSSAQRIARPPVGWRPIENKKSRK